MAEARDGCFHSGPTPAELDFAEKFVIAQEVKKAIDAGLPVLPMWTTDPVQDLAKRLFKQPRGEAAAA